MLTTRKIVDLLKDHAAKSGHNPTDYAVSKIMGIKDSVVNRWTRLGKTMSDENGVKAAEILGLSPEYVVACLNAERAQESEAAPVWANICHLLEAENDLSRRAA